jgi:hypothetical protein
MPALPRSLRRHIKNAAAAKPPPLDNTNKEDNLIVNS